ncbi:hypothetical protein BDF22DRAFT_700662 [Syncephalis plumigaleata]|nr:hypothetical protein BDF22DRAFT_700662 [Syncephalis plumigaleata]
MFVIQWAGHKDEKTAWTADDIWFTQEADHSIPLPWGFNILLNVCRLIAPSFYSDHVEDPVRPWTGCRMVCHVNLMNASEPVLPSPPDRGPDQKSTSNDDNQHDNEEEQHPHYNETAIRDTIAKHWSTAGVVENEFTNDKKTKKSSMKAQLMMKSASESEEAVSKERGRRRRKYFSSATKRQEFVLAPEQVYGCEFFSEQLDAWRMQLKMGISLDVASTVGNQPLRFILRSRDDPETIFFVVQLEYYP